MIYNFLKKTLPTLCADNNVHQRSIYLLSILSALTINLSVNAHADSTIVNNDSLSTLEYDYQLVSTEAYLDIAPKNIATQLTEKNLESLLSKTIKADQQKNPELAIELISANIDLIKSDIKIDSWQELTRILLKNHSRLLADKLLKIAESHGDDNLINRLKFEHSKYYSENNNWKEATRILTSIDIANSLPKENANEAFIVMGAALQQQKKHRESLAYYNKVKADSKHFRVAQLNSAVAFIRQDWWTDANIAITNAIEADPDNTDQLTDRLYTVMGYSQLQNGFYRNARESFRNVKVKSQYANRALLGIGMSALHQEDFIGAYNAFNLLKKKDQTDISVMEAYLLSSLALESLKQTKSAAGSHSEAISYYEQQSSFYQNQLNELLKQNNSGKIDYSLMEKINHDLKRLQPSLISITQKIRQLNTILKSSPKNEMAVRRVSGNLMQAYVSLASQATTEKQAIINNYLSQSRFGLAKLYDAQ